MEDNRSLQTETEVEIEHYEEIVGDMDYTTPVGSRPSSFISYSEDRTTATILSKDPLLIPTRAQ